MNLYIPLTNRALLALNGDDTRPFLQGLISNDINKVNPTHSIYALMLTPQGKFLYDFFIYEYDGKILLDCNAAKLEEIKKKFAMYKLRSKVVIEDISEEYEIVALCHPERKYSSFADPRSASLLARAIIKKPVNYSELEKIGLKKAGITDYEKTRISLCIPSDEDMGDSFPLEYEMDKHNAIDYEKGCYVGQEVTARTHYRGTIRKKPYVVNADANINLATYKGQELTVGTNKIGILCSAAGNIAIALIRMEDLEKAVGNIEVGGHIVKLSNNTPPQG